VFPKKLSSEIEDLWTTNKTSSYWALPFFHLLLKQALLVGMIQESNGNLRSFPNEQERVVGGTSGKHGFAARPHEVFRTIPRTRRQSAAGLPRDRNFPKPWQWSSYILKLAERCCRAWKMTELWLGCCHIPVPNSCAVKMNNRKLIQVRSRVYFLLLRISWPMSLSIEWWPRATCDNKGMLFQEFRSTLAIPRNKHVVLKFPLIGHDTSAAKCHKKSGNVVLRNAGMFVSEINPLRLKRLVSYKN